MQENINNLKLKQYEFLKELFSDSYFPNHLVDKGKLILVNLCLEIEKRQPLDLNGLYQLTHAATEKFNKLDDELADNDSEIDTVAREVIAENFEFIANAYGFEADIEELIETREW